VNEKIIFKFCSLVGLASGVISSDRLYRAPNLTKNEKGCHYASFPLNGIIIFGDTEISYY